MGNTHTHLKLQLLHNTQFIALIKCQYVLLLDFAPLLVLPLLQAATLPPDAPLPYQALLGRKGAPGKPSKPAAPLQGVVELGGERPPALAAPHANRQIYRTGEAQQNV